jgi:hypothetical protein
MRMAAGQHVGWFVQAFFDGTHLRAPDESIMKLYTSCRAAGPMRRATRPGGPAIKLASAG